MPALVAAYGSRCQLLVQITIIELHVAINSLVGLHTQVLLPSAACKDPRATRW